VTRITLSAFFAPMRDTPDHIRLAEELGFARAWCYDSPLLYDDVFVTLARAAERTSRIGLGVGVLVPGLRAPVVTANALSSVSALAPGRVVVAVGAGFTGALRWRCRPCGSRVWRKRCRNCGRCSRAAR
jgi:5,10-methylenetetrahydromethanopterin reductase